jgi:hypothetical protein
VAGNSLDWWVHLWLRGITSNGACECSAADSLWELTQGNVQGCGNVLACCRTNSHGKQPLQRLLLAGIILKTCTRIRSVMESDANMKVREVSQHTCIADHIVQRGTMMDSSEPDLNCVTRLRTLVCHTVFDNKPQAAMPTEFGVVADWHPPTPTHLLHGARFHVHGSGPRGAEVEHDGRSLLLLLLLLLAALGKAGNRLPRRELLRRLHQQHCKVRHHVIPRVLRPARGPPGRSDGSTACPSSHRRRSVSSSLLRCLDRGLLVLQLAPLAVQVVAAPYNGGAAGSHGDNQDQEADSDCYPASILQVQSTWGSHISQAAPCSGHARMSRALAQLLPILH